MNMYYEVSKQLSKSPELLQKLRFEYQVASFSHLIQVGIWKENFALKPFFNILVLYSFTISLRIVLIHVYKWSLIEVT